LKKRKLDKEKQQQMPFVVFLFFLAIYSFPAFQHIDRQLVKRLYITQWGNTITDWVAKHNAMGKYYNGLGSQA